MPISEPLVSSGTRVPLFVSWSAICGISPPTLRVTRAENAGSGVRRSGRRGSVPSVPGSPHAGRLLTLRQVFRTLPDRYLGAAPGFDATYHVRLGDVGHTWEIRLTEDRAHVRTGITRRRPDVTIGTDSETWLRLREGGLSGV